MMDAGNSLIRYADPSEIADVVAFFAGDGSRFVNETFGGVVDRLDLEQLLLVGREAEHLLRRRVHVDDRPGPVGRAHRRGGRLSA